MRGVKDYQFRRRVLELRLAGLSYRQIAAAVGHPRNPAYVWRIAKQELKEYTGAPAREVLALEQERLDVMLRAAWPAALQGDMKAVQAVLRIEDMRCRLLGLYANPPKPEGFPAPPGAVLVIPGAPARGETEQQALPPPTQPELLSVSVNPDLEGAVPGPPGDDALGDPRGDGGLQDGGLTDGEVS
jgi:hypothetical protein